MTPLEIRPVDAPAFQVAIDWAAAEGWNPGLDDLPVFHAADPDGFFIGYRGDTPVSSISVVRYGSGYGFLGFYIVHPEHRGSGIGLATWNTGMTYLERRTVGLDGVVAQQGNYRRSGFELAGRNIRYTGIPEVPCEARIGADICSPISDDLTALLDYDRPFFAGPRDRFIAQWILPAAGTRRVSRMAVIDGTPAGYGVIRACRSGYKIGPLFADDETTAVALFEALCNAADAGAEISLDSPESNAAARRLAERFGLKPAFETARMYRGPAPQLPISRIFGITSFELG